MGGRLSTNGLIPLNEVRARAAAALAPQTDSDPTVLVDVVDAVDPPALMLLWDDPWLEAETIGRCLWFARLEVRCIAGRLEPGAGVDTLEQLVSLTIQRLQADGYSWPWASTSAPRLFVINNVTLLGARVIYRVPVTT